MMRPWTRVVAAALAISIVCGAGAAVAYDRTQTCTTSGAAKCRPGESPEPIEWPVRCVRYVVNDRGSDDLGGAEGETIGEATLELVRDSFRRWSRSPSSECGAFTMEFDTVTDSKSAGFDPSAGFAGNENLIVWRDEDWPYEGTSYALTSVSYDSGSGRIKDADIQFNGVHYEFADLEESRVGSSESTVDFRNTLMHEIGHFAGLAHSEIPESTMYGRAPVGEIRKRTLHSDDIEGICAMYPQEGPAGECDDPSDFEPPSAADAGVSSGGDAEVGADALAKGGEREAGSGAAGVAASDQSRAGGCAASGASTASGFGTCTVMLFGLFALRLHRRGGDD